MLYSKQKWFCQICGIEQFSALASALWGGRVCSRKCWHELEWRRVCSILGQEYTPDTRTYDEDGNPVRIPREND